MNTADQKREQRKALIRGVVALAVMILILYGSYLPSSVKSAILFSPISASTIR